MTCAWRAPFENEALNRLHAEAFHHPLAEHDWWSQVNRWSLGWVCAQSENELVGFVNVAWDGAEHAIILDTMTAAHRRHQGIGREMVAVAASNAAEAGCQWLHVDCEQSLWPFYRDACGFRATSGGLLTLRRSL